MANISQTTQLDPNNDNELDTPPANVVFQQPSPTSTPASTPDTSTYDIQQVSLDPAQLGNVASSQEGTRARIAWTFTVIFLTLIVIAVLGPFGLYFLQAPGMQNPVEVSKELITIVSSVLAGPFGFIVGFYFKQSLNENAG